MVVNTPKVEESMSNNNVDVNKLFLPMALIIAVIGLVLLVCILLIGTGLVNPFIKCFAVDSAGKLYVGVTEQVLVYSDASIIRSFSSKTSRDYIFTITENDTILLATSSQNYTMDLYGNVLEIDEDKSGTQYPELQDNRTQLNLANGDSYAVKNLLGWTKIVKNGTTVVYQITGPSFLVKILLYLAVISFVLLWIKIAKTAPSRQRK